MVLLYRILCYRVFLASVKTCYSCVTSQLKKKNATLQNKNRGVLRVSISDIITIIVYAGVCNDFYFSEII